MAAGLGVSRQALHRRLAVDAEEEYEEARQRSFARRRFFSLQENIGWLSAISLDEVGAAPRRLARLLLALRQTPSWWSWSE